VGTALFLATIALVALEQGKFIVITLPLAVILWLWPVTPRWRCPACGQRFAAPEPEIFDDAEVGDRE
jgi:hypothetical protein